MENTINPYAAPVAPVSGAVPPPLPGEVRRAALAGRGARLIARIADRLLYLLCFAPVLVVAIAGARDMLAVTLVLGAFAMACLFIYNLVLLGDHGQTVGKRWLRIRIVRTDGSDADLGRVLGLRMFLPWLLGVFLGPFFVLPDLLCIFGNEKRCLHDMMADTVVVEA
jgi:uncharacterized RDD family membrane protein YckC